VNLGVHQRIDHANRILEGAAAAGEVVCFVREGSRGDREIQKNNADDYAGAEARPH
jgi:hypothetical protein